jgi:tetratricopeptide (TPR) repeat protein
MTRRPTLLLIVVLAGLSSALLAIATNIATSLLPAAWKPSPWLMWSLVAVLAVASIVAGVWQFLLHPGNGSGPQATGNSRSSGALHDEDAVGDRRGKRTGPDLTTPTPAQLPRDITDFTGRENDLDELRRRLKPTHGHASGPGTTSVSLIGGKPGIGKSALAIHLAHQLIDDFPDGQLYTDMRGGGPEHLTAPEVLSQFLRALGVTDEKALMDFDEQVARYRTLLAGRQMLVVLDNADDVIQVRPLLPGSPTCAVLITSRRLLYSLESVDPLILDVLESRLAVQLLGKLAGSARISSDPDAALEIAHYCGNLPLAIRIAGAKLVGRPAWPLKTLVDRLADERRRLGELQVGDLEVRTSFMLSYRDLTENDARVFRLTSLLDGPDVTTDVVAVLTNTDEEASQQSLERLVDAQLLETPVPDRYSFHDLLRLFARERAQKEESDEIRASAIKRALEWYQAALQQADERLGPEYKLQAGGERTFPSYTSALAWLEAERPNIVAAIRQASLSGWDRLTWELSEDMFNFFNIRKYWRDWQDISRLGLQAAQRAADLHAQARMLHNYGYVLRDRRSYQEAIALIEDSIATFRKLGDRFWEGRALGTLGTAYRGQQNFQQAVNCYERSLTIRREVHDELGEGQVLQALGTTYHQQGDFEKATDALRDSLVIFQRIGDRRGESRTLGLLGNTYLEQRYSAEAARFLKQSLVLSSETGAHYVESRTLTDLGRLYSSEQRYDDAIACLKQSLEIFQKIGDRYAEAQTLRNLAIVVEQWQDRKSAQPYWSKALAILEGLDPNEARKIRTWLEQPEQPRYSWSEWGIW